MKTKLPRIISRSCDSCFWDDKMECTPKMRENAKLDHKCGSWMPKLVKPSTKLEVAYVKTN